MGRQAQIGQDTDVVMLFFEAPDNPTARPRNAVAGHVVGIAVGAGWG